MARLTAADRSQLSAQSRAFLRFCGVGSCLICAVAALESAGLLGHGHRAQLWGNSSLAWASRFAFGVMLASFASRRSNGLTAVRLLGACGLCALVLLSFQAGDASGRWFYAPPLSAITLLFFALSGAFLEIRLELTQALAPWLGFAGVLLNAITLLGYLYRADLLYGGMVGGVGIFSAATSLLLGIGFIIAAGKDRAPLKLLTGQSITAQLLRALLPVTCLAMLLGEMASDWIRGATGRNLAAQDALQTIFATLFISGVVMALARRVGQRLEVAETRREKAEVALSTANESLARKVQERTAELQAANDELRVQILRHHETESALTQSEAKNSALLAALPDWIFLLTLDGQLLDARTPRERNGVCADLPHGLHAELSSKLAQLVGEHPPIRPAETFDFTLPLHDGTFEARLVRTEHSQVVAVVRDISELARLEREVLEANVREQRRIGEELHDGLGQQLTGVAFMSKILELELHDAKLPQAAQAAEIGRQVSASIATLRLLARGLFRYELGSGSLVAALEDLANAARHNYRVDCTLEADRTITLPDRAADLHLYRISQEAITNAVKHGRARKIDIQLKREGGQIVFRIRDDGTGAPIPPKNDGLGLRTMEFRTRRLGGRFTVEFRAGQGTDITCLLPGHEPVAPGAPVAALASVSSVAPLAPAAPEPECQKQLALFQ